MIYVGEILLIGLSARSSASVMLHGSAEPAVVAREGLISVQHYKESFAFKSKGPGSGLLRFFIPSLDISFVCVVTRVARITKVLCFNFCFSLCSLYLQLCGREGVSFWSWGSSA